MNTKRILVLGVVMTVLTLTSACAKTNALGEPAATEEALATESVQTEEVEVDQETIEEPEEAMEEAEEAEAEEAAVTAVPTDSGAKISTDAEALPEEVDLSNPKVNEVLNQITMVQHHHNVDTGVDTFTCASRGLGIKGVEPDPEGPRFVGPNDGDLDLWGAVGLFKVDPDGSVFFVPQQTGGKFLDPEGVEQEMYTLNEVLGFFAGGDAVWLGQHGEPGRIAECDPQYPKSD